MSTSSWAVYEMNNQKVEVKLGEIEHGWLEISFLFGSQEIHIDASDVPIDPIAELISLCAFLLSDTRGEHAAKFSLEPDYCVLTATKHATGDYADFRFRNCHGKFKKNAISCDVVALQIWRAVQAAKPRLIASAKADQWSWEFPETEMQSVIPKIQLAKERSKRQF